MRYLCLVFLVACGLAHAQTVSTNTPPPLDQTTPPPPAATTTDAYSTAVHDGSRLKVTYWVGADGSRGYRGLADTNYGGNNQCTPLVMSDGLTHCVPFDQVSNSSAIGPAAFVVLTAAP